MADAADPSHATRLADGRVLVAGGTAHNRIIDVTYWRSLTMPRPADYDEGLIDHDSLEVWAPRTGAWSAAGRFPVPLTEQTAVVLQDGRVAFVGGHASRRVPKRMAGGHWSIRYATWEFGGVLVWDPATARVTDINATPRRERVGALVLQDGRVLALGGVPDGNKPAPLDTGGDLLQALDPRTNSFATVGKVRVARASPLAVQLADGTVLIAGGAAGSSTALRRAGLPIEAWAPTASAAPALPEFDAPRDPQNARVLADGRVAIAACDRTILWNPATASWARADDLPPDSAGCRSVARGSRSSRSPPRAAPMSWERRSDERRYRGPDILDHPLEVIRRPPLVALGLRLPRISKTAILTGRFLER